MRVSDDHRPPEHLQPKSGGINLVQLPESLPQANYQQQSPRGYTNPGARQAVGEVCSPAR